MVQNRKKKKFISIHELYEVEVEDWDADYYFRLAPKNIIEGVYWEIADLIITGKLISPVLDAVGKVIVKIKGDPKMDDHWQPEPTIISAKSIGWMDISRGDNRLTFYCSVPSRSLSYIALAVQSGKTKYASISGTKLKWRQGTISSISLSKNREDG
jgi:hypothetical protein